MREEFFCNTCNNHFKMPKFYYEKRGFCYPPYERVAVCPICSGDDFTRMETSIEKIEVAERILYVILLLNRFTEQLEHIFGAKFRNSDLYNSVEILAEFMAEMFDYLDNDLQKQILNLNCEKSMDKIFMSLRGI